MGDRSHSQLYTALLGFLEEHGQAALEGINERGLPPERALEFLAMLEAHQVPLYGWEIWRSRPSGHDLDVTSIWCCTMGKHHQYAEARASLKVARPGAADLVAVQFG